MPLILSLLVAVVILVQGGLLVWWSLARSRSSLTINWLQLLALALLAGASSAGVLGLMLAQVGWFSLTALISGLSILAALEVALILADRQPLPVRLRAVASLELIGVGVLALAAVYVLHPPHQFITGGADAGVYINMGAQIARHGALLVHEPLVDRLDPALYPGLLREGPSDQWSHYIRLPGYYSANQEAGRSIPQFFPLQAVWAAIGFSIWGLGGALLVTPLFGVAGILALYLFGRAFIDWRFGLVPAALLLILPLQIYFAGYPTAEILTQAFTWLGLWCFMVYTGAAGEESDPNWRMNPAWGLGAALAFGQVFLARIDAFPMLLLPLLWAIILTWQRQWSRRLLWFWLPFGLLSAYALFHSIVFAWPYTYNTFGALVRIFQTQALLLIAVGAPLGVAGLWLLWQRPAWFAALGERSAKPLRYLAALAVLLLSVYAYFIRPGINSGGLMNYWYSGGQVPLSNHENLVRLGWYLTPLGIGLAAAGAIIMLLVWPWRRQWILWVVGGSFTFLYIYNILNNPFHMYAMRRYVPVVAPAMLTTGVFALYWLWGRRRSPLVTKGAAALLLAVWAGLLIRADGPVWKLVEYAGIPAHIEALARQFEPGAVVLFVDPAPVGAGSVLGTPLQFVYDMTAFDLQEEQLAMEPLLTQIGRWQAEGRPVYVAQLAGAAPLALPPELLAPVGQASVPFSILEQTYEHRPEAMIDIVYVLDLYRLAPVP